MRICLINPPSQFGRAPLPHMGIAYIAGMLKHSFPNIVTDVIDCPFQDINAEELKKKTEETYDVIGITTYFYNFSEVFKLVRFLNKLKKKPFIILGGYYPTLHPQKAFNIPHINCICIGEGEYVFKELIGTLLEKQDWRHINGLAFIDEQDHLVMNKVDPLIEKLDELPRPYLASAPPYWFPLVSGRGCHGHCTFCSIIDYYKKVPGKRSRKRCPAGVVEELKEITNQYQNRIVWMMDDNFFSVLQFQPEWIDEFVMQMQLQGVKCKFKIFARADEVDKEILLKLKSVGLTSVVVGVESMISRQLKLYGKNIEPQVNRDALQIIRETGLWLDMGFILLDPYTTLDELKINLTFLRDSPFVDSSEPGHELISSLGPLIVLEDTPIHRYLSKQNILSGTDVGYNYQSDEITFFHRALKMWNKMIADAYFGFNKKYLFDYYREHGTIKEDYLRRYKKCLSIDIACMWEILECLYRQPLKEIRLESLLEEYKKRFMNVIMEKTL